MVPPNTVLAQLIKLVPRHDFNRLAELHHGEAAELRTTSRWDQFVAMAVGQLARQSLRDIESNLKAQARSLYHLGTAGIARSSLARLNQEQSPELYQALFAQLYARCQSRAPRHPFRFKSKLYSIDSSLIDLSLSLFPWAHFSKGKGALKLMSGSITTASLPAFAVITASKCHDAHAARAFRLPTGSIAVFDRGYTDFRWFNSLNEQAVFFVTRIRRDIACRVTERRAANRAAGISSDQTIELTGQRARKAGLTTLRRVGYYDADSAPLRVPHQPLRTQRRDHRRGYKSRWQVELFFKWIKQNLKIKAFVATQQCDPQPDLDRNVRLPVAHLVSHDQRFAATDVAAATAQSVPAAQPRGAVKQHSPDPADPPLQPLALA